MPNDGGEIIVLWLPSEHRAGALGSATIYAASPGRRGAISTVKSDTRDAFDDLNHLTDRETMTIAAIKRQ